MAGFDPIYDCEETKDLDKKKRQILRDAIQHELNNSKLIRGLLRKKTIAVYKRLIGKRSSPRARTARKRA
jgi:hypothetical protein